MPRRKLRVFDPENRYVLNDPDGGEPSFIFFTPATTEQALVWRTEEQRQTYRRDKALEQVDKMLAEQGEPIPEYGDEDAFIHRYRRAIQLGIKGSVSHSIELAMNCVTKVVGFEDENGNPVENWTEENFWREYLLEPELSALGQRICEGIPESEKKP